MKCRIYKCKASCCYNIVLPKGFMERHADKAVTEPIGRTSAPTHPEFGECEIVFTDIDFSKNRCPFLRKDCKCNVYEDRPQICRMFGQEDHPLLKCQYRK